MGNTADLAMVQETIIDTLHKEGKPQRVITEMGGYSRSAVSKHIKCKVDWMNEIGYENVHKQQGWPQAWEYCQGKPIHTESFTRSELKPESVHQETPRSDIFRKRATKPLLKQEHRQKHLTWAKEKNNWTVAQWSKVFFSDESKFCVSFGNQGLEEEWRVTESMLLEVQCEVSTVTDDLGYHVICWCWSTVFSEVQSQRSHIPGNFRALHASFCWWALWRCWFHFPAGLGTCPHCQMYQKLVQWLWCYCTWLASKLAWIEPHR